MQMGGEKGNGTNQLPAQIGAVSCDLQGIIVIMKLALKPKVQKLIDKRIRSGQFQNAEDVVTAALASLGQQEEIAALSVRELEVLYPGIRQKIADGLAEAKAGKLSDGEAFFDELERQAAPRRAGRKTA